MEAKVDISVLGDKEVQRHLERINIAMQKKIVKGALRKAAKPVLATARVLCHELSGKLKRSLKIKAMRQRRGRFGTLISTGTREQLGIPADEKYFYPAAVEYGHDNVPAHSYLREAVDRNSAQTFATIASEVESGLRAAGAW